MKYLRETALGDMLDVVSAAKEIKSEIIGSDGKINADKNKFIKKHMGSGNQFKKSIISQSKDLIMTFPCIFENTISPQTASMVSKALDRKFIVIMQMLFASTIINDANKNKTAQDYINQFFTNMDFGSMNVDDVMKVFDLTGVYKEATLAYKAGILALAEADLKVKEDMERLVTETCFEESVSDLSLQHFIAKTVVDKYTIVKELSNIDDETEQEKADRLAREVRKAVIAEEKDKREKAKSASDLSKEQQERFKRQLMDSDIKKANELAPSLLIITFNSKVDEITGKEVQSNCIVGVKTRMIAVDSFEIMNKIWTKNKDNNGLIKLIRATTREISFVKDFLLAIDKAKIDALSNSKRGSVNPIWKVLERRSLKEKFRKAQGARNDASPITNLIVSQELVNQLKNTYNVNLEVVSVAREILDSYNLLSIEIVDETMETVRFLFNGDSDTWETLSFHSLERESGDGMYKKVINLMAKVK